MSGFTNAIVGAVAVGLALSGLTLAILDTEQVEIQEVVCEVQTDAVVCTGEATWQFIDADGQPQQGSGTVEFTPKLKE